MEQVRQKKKKNNKISFLYKKFPKNMQKKLALFFGAVMLIFAFLVGKVTYINATNGEKYTKIVLDQQQYNSRIIPYKRGDILDRNGTVLAGSERVYNVILDAFVMLSSDSDKEDKKAVKYVKEALLSCFDIKGEAVDQVVNNTPESRYSILKKQVSYEEAQAFNKLLEDKEKSPYISCIWLEDDYVRVYPYGRLASDVIGFTVAGNVGNAGIEASYNDILNGTNGREYGYQDTDSSLTRTVKNAVDGKSIVSTIDIALQGIVEKHILAFNESHKNEARDGEGSLNTAVIIMNPNNGEILAEASYPNYDLNNPRDLSAYYSEEEVSGMTADEKLDCLNRIWRNFCVSDTFEPGSTAKPFTVAAGLEDGTLKGNESYYCGGYKQVGGFNIHCNKREGHGTQSLSQGISNSCNVTLMDVAESVGAQSFSKYQRIFGFGQKTGIDLPGEAETAGLIYSADNMGPTELATNSFGQGFNVTMTQMVAAYASLINGGNYYKPHVVKQVKDSMGNVMENKDPVLLRKTVSEETCEMLKIFMKQTMTEGTGKRAQVDGYSMGGKTGTAEKIPREENNYVISFMGYAPAENPEVLVYAVIDTPNMADQTKSGVVTEFAKAIMEEAFPYLNITKAGGTQDSE